VENVGIPVKILGDIVVTRLNENFICWEFERYLFVVSLETNS
jgi:hypothetical protein